MADPQDNVARQSRAHIRHLVEGGPLAGHYKAEGGDPFDLLFAGKSMDDVYGRDPQSYSHLERFLASPGGQAIGLALNFIGGPAARAVNLSGRPRPSSAIRARENEAGYPPPPLAPRPFADDYPRSPHRVAGRPLVADIEGRPLVAKHVAGRRTVGGPDEGLSPEAVADVGRALGEVRFVPRSELPDRAIGQFLGKKWPDSFMRQPIREFSVAEDLPPMQKAITLAHEVGHGVSFGTLFPFRLGGQNEARKVYHELRTGKPAPPTGSHLDPELYGYHPRYVNEELRAELLRAYMMDPNYLKRTAPDAARSIRDAVNSRPGLKDIIQFNAVPPMVVAAPSAAALLDQAYPVEPTR